MLNYIDEEEIKEDIKYEVRSQIKEQITELVNNNKTELQEKLINKIIIELLQEIDFGKELKDLLYKKLVDGIEMRYNETDAFHITYDMNIDQIMKELYQNDKENIDNFLKARIEDALNNYKVNDYIFSETITNILTSNEKYIAILKEMLNDRLYDIIDKI